MLPNEEGKWMKFPPTGFLQNVRRAARRRTSYTPTAGCLQLVVGERAGLDLPA